MLNDLIIRKLPIPSQGVSQHADGKMPGFGVRVTANGVKSFYLAYRHHGQSRRIALGRYPSTSLQKARAKAHAALSKLADASDPAPPRIKPETFLAALEKFLDEYCRRHNRASTAAETERLLRVYFLPQWERRSVSSITRSDVAHALDPVMKRGAHAAARHAFAAVRKLFNWLVERGAIDASPCAGMKPPAKAAHRDRVLSDAELARIWKAADAQGFPFGRITQLLMLTAQRRMEVSSMMWDELNLEEGVWTIPAERTKNGKPHAVPLAPGAIAVLNQIPRTTSPFVFPARGKPDQPYTGWSKGKRMLDADADLHDWTLHDLRRTAATGMARAGIAPHVVERVLNHVSGTFAGVAGVYNRFQYAPEMRIALNVWDQHVRSVSKELSADANET